MREAFTVFKKELIDTLRDRRTIIAMVVVPLLLFPAFFIVTSMVMQSQSEQAAEKTLEVALINATPEFEAQIADAPNMEIVRGVSEDSARARIRRGDLNAAFAFAPDFAEQVSNLNAGTVQMIYKSGDNSSILLRRLNSVADRYERQLLETRFASLDISLSATDAVQLREVDVATAQEQIAQAVGGFLPYVFIIFCFLGGMYPAIDLGAGEKERGTLEALLTTPVNRMHLLIGKLGVIVLTGVLSAVIAILSIVLTPQFIDDIPQSLLDAAYNILDPGVVAVLLSLLIPLTIFFGAAQLSLSFYAKSFKEAQSIINPLTIAVIFPAFIALLPGIELNTWTALVPVLNVSLATKAVIGGTFSVGHLALVYISLIAFAAIGLAVCAHLFQRENVIFRV